MHTSDELDKLSIFKNTGGSIFFVMKLLMAIVIVSIFTSASVISMSKIAYGQSPDQALSAPTPSEQPAAPPTNTPPGQIPEQVFPPASSQQPNATCSFFVPPNETLEQALSSRLSSSSSPCPSSNQTVIQPEQEQHQQLPSSSSAVPGLLFSPQQQPTPPEEQQQIPQQQPAPPQPEQPPATAPITQTTANGTIDSLIFAPGTRWIATGNWTLVLTNGNVNSFNANMTWYNNNGTGTHTHELLNLRASPVDITQQSGDNILIRGLTDVGTNHRITWTDVPTTLDIKAAKTISISLDDIKTNRHFAGQAIYGVLRSFTQCSDQPGQNMEVLPPCSPPSSSSP